ncbi:MAG: hypothetical protein WKF50_11195 [Nocardioides sp.]
MTRAVRVLGQVLLVVGCVAWAWVAMLEAPVDRVAAPGSGTSDGIGLVELELYVLDLRLAPLLLAVAGVGLLVAPFVRRPVHGVYSMSAALGAALLVSAAVQPLSVWWVGAVVLAALLAGIARLTIRRSGPLTPRGGDEALSLPGRTLTTSVALVLLCSAFPMEVFLDFGDPVLGALPDAYRVAVPVLEGLMLLSGMIALLMAARRLTWLHPVACFLVLAELVALISTGKSAAWMMLTLAAVVTATAAAVAGERGRVWHPAVAVTAGCALLYPGAVLFAILASFTLGGFPLALNGGEIDYDGLPVFLTGPLSAAFPVLLYLAGAGASAETVAPRVGGDPSVEPTYSTLEGSGH